MAWAGSAHAVPTVYTSLPSFLAATVAPGTDTFDDVSNLETTRAPAARSAGTYTYTASVSDGGAFFGAGSDADRWLSADIAIDSITFSGFSSGVSAIGGLFFGSNVLGSFAPGSITVTVVDASGTTTEMLADPTTASFLGFVSSDGLTSLTIMANQPAGAFLWASADDLVLAAVPVVAVPEPSTTALLLAGLGTVGWVAARRRQRAG